MSESLRQIGQQAEENYSAHKRARNMITKNGFGERHDALEQKRIIDREATTIELASMALAGGTVESINNAKEYKSQAESKLSEIQSEEALQNLNFATHYQDNAGEYHDLAKIEAHLDGVKINVSQPLEIGELVEVHHK